MGDKVIVIKLMSGEMFVSKVTIRNNMEVYQNPVIFMPTGQGQQVQMVPVRFGHPYSEDKEIVINTEHITCTLQPTEELKRVYLEFTTGLVTPVAGQLQIP